MDGVALEPKPLRWYCFHTYFEIEEVLSSANKTRDFLFFFSPSGMLSQFLPTMKPHLSGMIGRIHIRDSS